MQALSPARTQLRRPFRRDGQPLGHQPHRLNTEGELQRAAVGWAKQGWPLLVIGMG